jgi:hypothetical protein
LPSKKLSAHHIQQKNCLFSSPTFCHFKSA